MWSAINGVAGNLSQRASVLANKLLEADDELIDEDTVGASQRGFQVATGQSGFDGVAEIDDADSIIPFQSGPPLAPSTASSALPEHSHPDQFAASGDEPSPPAVTPTNVAQPAGSGWLSRLSGAKNYVQRLPGATQYIERLSGATTYIEQLAQRVAGSTGAAEDDEDFADTGNPDVLQRYKEQVQRLKLELYGLANSHEEELLRLEVAHHQHIDALKAELALLRDQNAAVDLQANPDGLNRGAAVGPDGDADQLPSLLAARVAELKAKDEQLAAATRAAQETERKLQHELKTKDQQLAAVTKAAQESERKLAESFALEKNRYFGELQQAEQRAELLQQRVAELEAASESLRKDSSTAVNADMAMAAQQRDLLRQQLEEVVALGAQRAQQAAAELAAQQERSAQLASELEATKQQLSRVQKQLEARKAEAETLMDQLSAGGGGSALAEQLQRQRQIAAETQAQLEAALVQLQQAQEEADNAMSDMAERDTFWIRELDNERKAHAETRAQLAQAQVQGSAAPEASSQLQRLEQQLLAEQEAHARVRQELAAALETAAQLQKLEQELHDQQLAHADAKEQLSAMQDTATQFEQQLHAEQSEHASTKAALEASSTQLQLMQQQLRAEEAAHATAGEDLLAAQADIEALRAAAADSSTQLLQERRRHEEAQVLLVQEVADLTTQLEKLTQQLEQEQCVNRDLSSRLAGADAAAVAPAVATSATEQDMRVQELHAVLESERQELRAAKAQLQELLAGSASSQSAPAQHIAELEAARVQLEQTAAQLSLQLKETQEQLQLQAMRSPNGGRGTLLEQLAAERGRVVELQRALQEEQMHHEQARERLWDMSTRGPNQTGTTAERAEQQSPELEACRGELAAAQEALSTADAKVLAALQQCSMLEAELAKERQAVAVQLEQLALMEAQLEVLSKEREAAIEAAATAQGQLSELRARADEEGMAALTAAAEVQELKTELQQVQQQLHLAHEQLEHQRTRSSASAESTPSADRLEDLLRRIHELQSQLEAAATQVQHEKQLRRSFEEAAADEAYALRQQLDDLEVQLKQEQQQHAALARQVAELEQSLVERNEVWRQELLQEETAHREAEKRLAAAQLELQSAREASAALEAKLVDQEAALEERLHALEQQRASSSGRESALKAQLLAVQERCEQAEHDLGEVQQQLLREQSRVDEAVQERDDFWRGELARATMAQQQLQQQLQSLQAELAAQQHAGSTERDEQLSALTLKLEQAQADMHQQAREVEGLRRDLQAAQAALDEAQRAAALESSVGYQAESDLERQLSHFRAECAKLQGENLRLQAQVSELYEQVASSASSSLASQRNLDAARAEAALAAREREDLRIELEAVRSQLSAAAAVAPANDARLETAQHSAAASRAAAEAEASILVLRDALSQAEGERDRARARLARMKQQMMAEQENEEDKLTWRVEAEVKLAMEATRVQQAELQAQLAASQARIRALEGDTSTWETALAAKDREIANLQAALGELTYESDAAERLRNEVRMANAKAERLTAEAAQLRESIAAAEKLRQSAEESAMAAGRVVEEWRVAETRARDECAMMQRALEENMRRLSALSSDSGTMVDRRIVVKLLVTFFERNHSKEVLALMARMLNFSEEDQARIGLAGGRKGLLGALGGLIGLGGNKPAVGKDTLADKWVDFLLQEVERDGNQAALAGAAAGLDPSGKAGVASGYAESFGKAMGMGDRAAMPGGPLGLSASSSWSERSSQKHSPSKQQQQGASFTPPQDGDSRADSAATLHNGPEAGSPWEASTGPRASGNDSATHTASPDGWNPPLTGPSQPPAPSSTGHTWPSSNPYRSQAHGHPSRPSSSNSIAFSDASWGGHAAMHASPSTDALPISTMAASGPPSASSNLHANHRSAAAYTTHSSNLAAPASMPWHMGASVAGGGWGGSAANMPAAASWSPTTASGAVVATTEPWSTTDTTSTWGTAGNAAAASTAGQDMAVSRAAAGGTTNVSSGSSTAWGTASNSGTAAWGTAAAAGGTTPSSSAAWSTEHSAAASRGWGSGSASAIASVAAPASSPWTAGTGANGGWKTGSTAIDGPSLAATPGWSTAASSTVSSQAAATTAAWGTGSAMDWRSAAAQAYAPRSASEHSWSGAAGPVASHQASMLDAGPAVSGPADHSAGSATAYSSAAEAYRTDGTGGSDSQWAARPSFGSKTGLW